MKTTISAKWSSHHPQYSLQDEVGYWKSFSLLRSTHSSVNTFQWKIAIHLRWAKNEEGEKETEPHELSTNFFKSPSQRRTGFIFFKKENFAEWWRQQRQWNWIENVAALRIRNKIVLIIETINVIDYNVNATMDGFSQHRFVHSAGFSLPLFPSPSLSLSLFPNLHSPPSPVQLPIQWSIMSHMRSVRNADNRKIVSILIEARRGKRRKREGEGEQKKIYVNVLSSWKIVRIFRFLFSRDNYESKKNWNWNSCADAISTRELGIPYWNINS